MNSTRVQTLQKSYNMSKRHVAGIGTLCLLFRREPKGESTAGLNPGSRSSKRQTTIYNITSTTLLVRVDDSVQSRKIVCVCVGGGGGMVPLPPPPLPCNENDSLELWIFLAFSLCRNTSLHFICLPISLPLINGVQFVAPPKKEVTSN